MTSPVRNTLGLTESPRACRAARACILRSNEFAPEPPIWPRLPSQLLQPHVIAWPPRSALAELESSPSYLPFAVQKAVVVSQVMPVGQVFPKPQSKRQKRC